MSSLRAVVLAVWSGDLGVSKTILGAGKIKTTFMIILRHYLPFLPSLSHNHTVEFSGGYRTCGTGRFNIGRDMRLSCLV